MLNWLKERQTRARSARELYGAIVMQARQPEFYDGLGIPDTAQGRFEILALHVAVMMRRLQSEGREGQALARVLAETFVTDMDDCMREMTFSDLAVPREIKRIAAALYDRHAALDSSGHAALALALDRQLGYLQKEGRAPAIDSGALARYAGELAGALAAEPLASLCRGQAQWPRLDARGGESP